jgi:hypothetical protein
LGCALSIKKYGTLNPAKQRCFRTVTSYQWAILDNNVLFITLIFAGWFKASMKTIGIWMEKWLKMNFMKTIYCQ